MDLNVDPRSLDPQPRPEGGVWFPNRGKRIRNPSIVSLDVVGWKFRRDRYESPILYIVTDFGWSVECFRRSKGRLTYISLFFWVWTSGLFYKRSVGSHDESGKGWLMYREYVHGSWEWTTTGPKGFCFRYESLPSVKNNTRNLRVSVSYDKRVVLLRVWNHKYNKLFSIQLFCRRIWCYKIM